MSVGIAFFQIMITVHSFFLNYNYCSSDRLGENVLNFAYFYMVRDGGKCKSATAFIFEICFYFLRLRVTEREWGVQAILRTLISICLGVDT